MAIGGGPAPVSPALDSAQRDEIRSQLARLLATSHLRIFIAKGPLLRYLVERALAGEGDGINEYAIGLDVFEKPASFDPRIESIVRNEAGRLRQGLRDYYAESGRQDRVLIELPPRGYKPAFIFRETQAPPISLPAGEHPTGITMTSMPHRPLRLLLSGMAVAAALISASGSMGAYLDFVAAGFPTHPLPGCFAAAESSNDPGQEYFTDGMTDEPDH